MNHVVKFSTSYNFYAFSTKYYEVSYGTRCLCRQNFSNDQRVEYATYKPAILRKLKLKKPWKAYNSKLKKTDLLKVTKTHAIQERMTIAKLKASQIAAFAQEPGMFLDNLYDFEFRKKTHPYKEKVTNKNEFSFMDEKPMVTPEEGSVPQQKTTSNLNMFYQVLKSELLYSNKNEFICGYLDVCLNSNLSNLAHKYLRSEKNELVKYPYIYEVFLSKYIEDKNFSEIEDLMNLMEKRNVNPNDTITALYFDYLYRSNLTSRLKVRKARQMLMKHRKSGGKIEDILAAAGASSKKNVLQVLQWAYPNFRDTKLDDSSNYPLIRRLYKDANIKMSPSHPIINKEDFLKLADEQISLEKSCYVAIDSVFPRFNGKYKNVNKWNKLMDIWREKLRENLILNLEALKTSRRKYDSNFYPFLNSLPVDDMVDIMMVEIQLLCGGSKAFTLSSAITYKALGHKVWQRYIVRKKCSSEESLNKYKSFVNKYMDWYVDPDNPKQNYREKWQNLMYESRDISFLTEKSYAWTDDLKTRLGKFMFDIIFKNTVIPPDFLPKGQNKKSVSGFYLVLRHQPSKNFVEQIRFHPVLAKLYQEGNNDKLLFKVKDLPMICPPKPWTSINSGGLYMLTSRFLRYTPFDYNTKVLSKIPDKNLFTLFDSLNQLQSVAWVMNCNVLDVAIEVFNQGGSEELNVPMHPDSLPGLSNLKVSIYEREKILQEKHDLYGLWCECLYKLSLANHFRNRVFWLPYNIDFRGRVYPVPPHVNHICSDLYRSLYVFANKKPLGPKGLDWLKIHCINLCGTHKKKSLSERLEHANEMLPEILDSAENPLHGRRWWAKAEDPWQTLATCMEISNAVKSGNPETYETGFPVHQDGSCNGLQHYAALGRDPIGAASVNLAPNETPQDVYEVVVNIVEGMRKKDVEDGVEIAKVLEGFVMRKVIKQTVMTTVYGVTHFGAKAQIANKLKDLKEFPSGKISLASTYLTNKVFAALNEMFTSAQDIQRWFLKCAHTITSELKKSVTWVTPLGLPVVQPYFKTLPMNINPNKLIPEKRKQGNAFPPNFIHSLDSSHMMLTALSCGIHGITFASIHDCYWTHPVDIDRMNVICRSKFIELHSENILEDLAKHFHEFHKDADVGTDVRDSAVDIFKAVPKKGKFNLDEVSNSVYFFS